MVAWGEHVCGCLAEIKRRAGRRKVCAQGRKLRESDRSLHSRRGIEEK
jgi:hypothetical protein